MKISSSYARDSSTATSAHLPIAATELLKNLQLCWKLFIMCRPIRTT
ncbi:hypothetical protein DICVIV_09224 [Dictyocaulus viviparus]|uniref:Uncharacterized protein n=1 Tax=Dictyocaulus viviparus TaxID=29172 RepID=A0A0D8XJK4_DICVI|nr:hypothetical protein DICVIV_09224 [Dictyocaulus viviparus]